MYVDSRVTVALDSGLLALCYIAFFLTNTTMSDAEKHFAEQQEIMDMPDEPLEDYVMRMAVVINRYIC